MITKQKYYFIYYECKMYGWKPESMGGASTESYVVKAQELSLIHPLKWQMEMNEKYGKQHEVIAGHTSMAEYLVSNWIEINEEEYYLFLGHIG